MLLPINPVVNWVRVAVLGAVAALVAVVAIQHGRVKYLEAAKASAEQTAKTYETSFNDMAKRSKDAKVVSDDAAARADELEQQRDDIQRTLNGYLANYHRPPPPTAACPADGWLSTAWVRLYNRDKDIASGTGKLVDESTVQTSQDQGGPADGVGPRQ